MKMRAIFFTIFFCANLIQLANAKTALAELSWLEGNWTTVFNNNSLTLSFTDPKGDIILSTYKSLSLDKNNQISFIRFLSIQQNQETVFMRLFPFLQASSDVFKLVDDKNDRFVFERVYSNQACQIQSLNDAKNDSLELQKVCDRFPVQIIWNKISPNEFEEHFIGFKPVAENQKALQFSRTFTK